MKYLKSFSDISEGKLLAGAMIGASLLTAPSIVKSQTVEYEMHGAFSEDKELKTAIHRCDFSKLSNNGKVSVVIEDKKEKVVTIPELNKIVKKYMPKDAFIKKSSETNNGYTQAYGAYKGYDALVYFTFIFDVDGVLMEVDIDKN